MKQAKASLTSKKSSHTRTSSACDVSSQRRQLISAMYAHIMTSWEDLPEDSKRALGFDCVVGSEGEEQALNQVARVFMDYAEMSFRRALIARRRRLGLDD